MKIIIFLALIVFAVYTISKRSRHNTHTGKYQGTQSRYSQSRPSQSRTPQQNMQSPVARNWEDTWQPSTPMKASGKCGNNVTWSLFEDGQMIITGAGPMFDYEPATMNDGKNVTPWYPYRMQIKSVKVGKGVTHLADWAFAYCKNLESAILSCSIKTMSWGGFFECEKLRKITIPAGVWAINSDCFLECLSLAEVCLPNTVTKIGESAFSGCINLTTINFPDSLEEIDDDAFGRCTSLKQVYLPRNISSVNPDAFRNSGIRVLSRR